MSTSSTVVACPFSTDELRELRKTGFRWDDEEGGLVHRACNEVVSDQPASHHDSCRFVRFLDMGYARKNDGFVHMPWGCSTTNPDTHKQECQANYHP